MGKWVRLVLMLGIIAGAGILLVHRQTTIVVLGYSIAGLMSDCENRREENRKLRINLENELAPQAVKKRAKALGIDLDQPRNLQYRDLTSVDEFYELGSRGGRPGRD